MNLLSRLNEIMPWEYLAQSLVYSKCSIKVHFLPYWDGEGGEILSHEVPSISRELWWVASHGMQSGKDP